ncbi:uncharacterized protein G2W53_044023 [Senna tora]|uniref:Uncharacterized protein n=1 Tax=Senna tora TaxID=362788 RepID=A0A834SJS0_9FABA|nr:uncharacterized protein G2W53_044023 [Senna tora]
MGYGLWAMREEWNGEKEVWFVRKIDSFDPYGKLRSFNFIAGTTQTR